MSMLPPPQKDGEIKFFMARGLPYRTRMALVFGLLASGLGLQVTLGFWPGFMLLVLGQLLGMNTGYSAVPRTTPEEAWARVTPDEYTKVKARADELRKWDEDFFDGTSTRGLIGFFITGLLCVIGFFLAASAFSFPPDSFVFFGLDAAVLLLPLWFIGTRTYLKKDRLIIKIDMLRKVMAALSGPSDVQVQPMLSLRTTEGGGKEPEDARLMVKLVGAPREFHGVQVQLSINSVQGKDFPYLYCVLIAKKGSGLLGDYRDFIHHPETSLLSSFAGALFGMLPGGATRLVYEPSAPGDVEIIVIRQETTRKSGYFTPPAAALNVVESSLAMARSLVKRSSRMPAPGGIQRN